MLAELSNLHGVVIGGLLFVGLPVGAFLAEALPHVVREQRARRDPYVTLARRDRKKAQR